jgi:hypothetical protein
MSSHCGLLALCLNQDSILSCTHINWNIVNPASATVFIVFYYRAFHHEPNRGTPVWEEHALSSKWMGRDPVKPIIMQLLCVVYGCLHLQMTQCNTYQFCSCFCSCRTFRNLFHDSSQFVKFRLLYSLHVIDRLCGRVVRVSGYRSRGPGFDSWRFQIFWEAVGLERGPLSLVRTTEELLGRNNSGFGQENRD